MRGLKQEGVIRYMGIGGTTDYTMADVIVTGQFDVILTSLPAKGQAGSTLDPPR